MNSRTTLGIYIERRISGNKLSLPNILQFIDAQEREPRYQIRSDAVDKRSSSYSYCTVSLLVQIREIDALGIIYTHCCESMDIATWLLLTPNRRFWRKVHVRIDARLPLFPLQDERRLLHKLRARII